MPIPASKNSLQEKQSQTPPLAPGESAAFQVVSTQLSADYYLDNFFTLLDDVTERYSSILSPQEKSFHSVLKSMDRDAARLYVRLILRTGPYFRRDKLKYDEIGDMQQAISVLQAVGFLRLNDQFPAQELLPFLTRPELVKMAVELNLGNLSKQLKKSQILECLAAEDLTLIGEYLTHHYQFLLPLNMERVKCYRLLFFGNLYQEMSEFILEDLGHLRFEKYVIRDEDRLFKSRELVELSLRIIDSAETLYQAIESNHIADIEMILHNLLDLTITQPSISRRCDKVFNTGARHLERLQQLKSALFFYEQSQLPPARERRVRILEKQGEDEAAFLLLQQIQTEPWDDSEQEFITRFAPKLYKKLKIPHTPTKRIQHPSGEISLERIENRSIEQQVLDHYIKQGWNGFFSENWLWNALFGLYFWDIIFASSPGAFFNPYQRGPKDLFSAEFYRQRQQAIAQRLQQLQTDQNYPQAILQTFEEKSHTANFLVNWKTTTREQLALALEHIPVEHLQLILATLAENPGTNRAGFPDLFLVKEEQYVLLEVKGPGDQLQLSQKRWLKRFQTWQIPYQICRVSWA